MHDYSDRPGREVIDCGSLANTAPKVVRLVERIERRFGHRRMRPTRPVRVAACCCGPCTVRVSLLGGRAVADPQASRRSCMEARQVDGCEPGMDQGREAARRGAADRAGRGLVVAEEPGAVPGRARLRASFASRSSGNGRSGRLAARTARHRSSQRHRRPPKSVACDACRAPRSSWCIWG